MFAKLLGIINVGFSVIDKLLITFFSIRQVLEKNTAVK
jgi:hypothetical protein